MSVLGGCTKTGAGFAVRGEAQSCLPPQPPVVMVVPGMWERSSWLSPSLMWRCASSGTDAVHARAGPWGCRGLGVLLNARERSGCGSGLLAVLGTRSLFSLRRVTA